MKGHHRPKDRRRWAAPRLPGSHQTRLHRQYLANIRHHHDHRRDDGCPAARARARIGLRLRADGERAPARAPPARVRLPGLPLRPVPPGVRLPLPGAARTDATGRGARLRAEVGLLRDGGRAADILVQLQQEEGQGHRRHRRRAGNYAHARSPQPPSSDLFEHHPIRMYITQWHARSNTPRGPRPSSKRSLAMLPRSSITTASCSALCESPRCRSGPVRPCYLLPET